MAANFNLSERERNLAIIVAGLIICYAFFQFLLAPKWNENSLLRDKLRASRLDLKINQEKLKILETIEKKFGALPEKSLKSHGERSLEALKNISQALAQSRLNLTSIQPVIEEGKEGFKFNLSCSGSYRNLYDFLVLFRQTQTLISIDRLDINLGEDKELAINITLTAY